MISYRTARKRAREGGWLDKVKSEADWLAVREGCVWDQARADHITEFFRRYLVFAKGILAKRPFEPLEWESERVLQPVFAWLRPDGSRRFRRVLVWIGRRNGKSTLIAGLSLYMLMADGEHGAECYILASTIKQAKALYGSARDMAKLSPDLKRRLRFNDTVNLIRYDDAMSHMSVLAPDADSVLGIDPHLLVVDELVAQPNRKLWDALRYATTSRRQPLTVAISTAGWNRELIAGEVYDYACGVRDGTIIDSSFLPVIFEAPKDCDPGDEAAWMAANPSLGHVLPLTELRAEYAEAVASPRKMSAFRMFRLNQWTSSAEAYIDMARWEECSSRPPKKTYLEWRDELLEMLARDQTQCWLGLDCGGSRDLTALTLLARFDNDDYKVACWVWCPEKSTRPNERPEIEGFIAEGLVELMPGDWTDFATIEDKILELVERLNVVELAFDRCFAGPLIQRLMPEVECTPVAQTAGTLNDPTRELDRLILAGKLDHGGSGVLTWSAGNLEVKRNSGDQLKPMKPSSAKKIDPMSALITGLARAMLTPTEERYTKDNPFFFTGDKNTSSN